MILNARKTNKKCFSLSVRFLMGQLIMNWKYCYKVETEEDFFPFQYVLESLWNFITFWSISVVRRERSGLEFNVSTVIENFR